MTGKCDCCGFEAEDLVLTEYKVWAAYDFAVTEDEALAVKPEPHGIHGICLACQMTGAARARFGDDGDEDLAAKVLAAIAWSHNSLVSVMLERADEILARLR